MRYSTICKICSALVLLLATGCNHNKPPAYISAEKAVVIFEKDSEDPTIFRVVDGSYVKEDGEVKADPARLAEFAKGLPEKLIGLSQGMYLHLRERAAKAKLLESTDG